MCLCVCVMSTAHYNRLVALCSIQLCSHTHLPIYHYHYTSLQYAIQNRIVCHMPVYRLFQSSLFIHNNLLPWLVSHIVCMYCFARVYCVSVSFTYFGFRIFVYVIFILNSHTTDGFTFLWVFFFSFSFSLCIWFSNTWPYGANLLLCRLNYTIVPNNKKIENLICIIYSLSFSFYLIFANVLFIIRRAVEEK